MLQKINCGKRDNLKLKVSFSATQVFLEAKRTSPSILYIPHIQQWWDTAAPSLRASFFSLLDSIPSFSPILLLATCSVPLRQLDPEVISWFYPQWV